MFSKRKPPKVDCLLNKITWREYKLAQQLNDLQCQAIIAEENLEIVLNEDNNNKKLGENVAIALDAARCTRERYFELLDMVEHIKPVQTYYEPQTKVAILVANQDYQYLPKLVTPIKDCETLGKMLRKLDFIVIQLTNVTGNNIKDIISQIFDVIPKKSYCFYYYAGHGCEVYNYRVMLNVDCPPKNMEYHNVMPEQCLLLDMYKCKPEQLVVVLDMCRCVLDEEENPKVYAEMPKPDTLNDKHWRLTLCYSTSPTTSAYEAVNLECNTDSEGVTGDSQTSYVLQSKDLHRIRGGSSQYLKFFCNHLYDGKPINETFDVVHQDMEILFKNQQLSVKTHWGSMPRSFYDPIKGDRIEVHQKLSIIGEKYKDVFTILPLWPH